ncbi:MAG TPA: nucleotidyltransferase domain-containing protein [Niabella sp.]
MKPLSINDVKKNGWLILEVISGSRAYGLDTPASDTDIKGVFVLPQELYYSMEYTAQVANETNDIVYYELNRFMELLARNNPNILELLAVPEDCILLRHPLMDLLSAELFLSRLCEQTFANYAYSQIKKARGLEKKIVNPMGDERKIPADFCYVYTGKSSIPLTDYLRQQSFTQESMGLSALLHFKDFTSCIIHHCRNITAYSEKKFPMLFVPAPSRGRQYPSASFILTGMVIPYIVKNIKNTRIG